MVNAPYRIHGDLMSEETYYCSRCDLGHGIMQDCPYYEPLVQTDHERAKSAKKTLKRLLKFRAKDQYNIFLE